MGTSEDHGVKEWRAVVAAALFLLFAFGFIVWMGDAKGEEASQCPTETQEDRITEAIAVGDHIWIFQGEGLNTFLQSLKDYGLMGSNPVNVDKVYVAFDGKHYTVFFLFNHCIVFAAHGPTSVMERILPK